MELKSKLLVDIESDSMSFDSSVKGLYNTMQFVLRLNEDVRFHLKNGDDSDPDKIQASSTYLHETIHWWQHIGSNLGFIFNLSYPAFATDSYFMLIDLVKKGIKHKPIVQYEDKYYKKTGKTDVNELNRVVNNFYDLEYAKNFLLSNQNIRTIKDDQRFFLSMGHSFMIMWSNSIEKVAETIDDKFTILPNINNWVSNFKELEQNKVEGFYINSNYKVSKVGMKAIFEGQSVFNQIIYLANAFKENNIVFKDFIDKGMLHGIYLEAFDYYLEIIGEERPILIDKPLINLFLLVCDLSINPNNGFPFDIYDYENFININDPGVRFFRICRVIRENKEYYLKNCDTPTKSIYIKLSWKLNRKIGSKCSYESIKQVIRWSDQKTIKKILKELETYKFEDKNMPFRLFVSKFIDFNKDKYWYPEKFCWIGEYLSNGDENSKDLLDKHPALFLEAEDGEIKAKTLDNIPEKKVLKTFNQFYTNIIVYELILKWVSEKGDFKIDYKWLANERGNDILEVVKRDFCKVFGVSIDEIEIIE